MDVTFYFKRKSIFWLANSHKCCIHSPKCYTNITDTFCPQQGKRGCLNTFCSNRNKRGKGEEKGQEEMVRKHLIMEMTGQLPALAPYWVCTSWIRGRGIQAMEGDVGLITWHSLYRHVFWCDLLCRFAQQFVCTRERWISHCSCPTRGLPSCLESHPGHMLLEEDLILASSNPLSLPF